MDHTARTGRYSIVLGALALGALAWTWALSVLPDLNPPNLVRIPGILLLPVGVLAGLATGVVALRGDGHRDAVIGLALAGLAVVGFVVLLAVAG